MRSSTRIGYDETRGLHGEMRRASHRAEPKIRSVAAQARRGAEHAAERLERWLLLGLGGTLLLTLILCVYLFRTFQSVEGLRRSVAAQRQELEVTLKSIGDGVLATDRDGRIRLLNGVASTLTGFTFDEAQGRPVDEVFRIFSGITGEPVATPVREVLDTGKIVGLANHTVLEGKDGTRRHIADSAAPIFDLDGSIVGTVLVFRDVTEQYRLEEQLRQSGKLESLGLLAGGVAHDFNNLLTAIMSAAEVLKLDERLDPMSQESIDVILLSSTRAADLTGKLLSFSRKGKMVSSPVDIHPLLGRVVGILKSSLSKDIEIVMRLDAGQAEIIGDPSQLEGVFMNLGINGADAMPNGGKLTFSTEVRFLDETFCEASAFDIHPGWFLQVSVEDEGEGIDAETQKRIFEPFFTTKPEGAGTGLGLASAYGAVKDHEGDIRVYSEPSHGTVFRLLFPLNQSRSHRPSVPTEAEIPRGSGKILVVDDESFVRNTTRLILESLGYQAQLEESAADGLAALETGEFALAMIDMVMPKMSGEELFYEIRSRRPQMPVVLMSGFTREANVSEMRKNGLADFVRKPFTRAEVADVLQRALCEK